MHALIIDDSRAMRRIIGDMMRQLGFDVDEAVNGKAGYEQLAAGPAPDVVLVDWNMPEMNGLEFVQAVRADNRYANVPLVMVTTETEMEKVAAALGDGANEYVMKPCSREMLGDKLQLLGLKVETTLV